MVQRCDGHVDDVKNIIVFSPLMEADFLVSGDQHLKSLGKFRRIRIVSPGQFVDIL
jgi:predicted nucleic acid-binding protein